MKKVIYVNVDGNSDSGGEDLLAWKTLVAAENGYVGIYELVEVVEKREAVEVRRKGTKAWVKSSAAPATA